MEKAGISEREGGKFIIDGSGDPKGRGLAPKLRSIVIYTDILTMGRVTRVDFAYQKPKPEKALDSMWVSG